MAEPRAGRRSPLPGGPVSLLVPLYDAAWVAAWIGLISELPAFAGHRPLLHGLTVFWILAAVRLATRFVLRLEWSIEAARLVILIGAALSIALGLFGDYRGALLGA